MLTNNMIYKEIIMKKVLPILSLAISVAFTANATEQEQTNTGPKVGWYLGVDVHNSELEIESFAGYEIDDISSESAIGIVLGYEQKLSDEFMLAIEGEYVFLGEYEVMLVNAYREIDLDFYNLNLNIKPKYYFTGTGFYLGASAGIGTYGVDASAGNISVTDNGMGFNFGAEAGYEFSSGVVLSGGYRSATVEIDSIDFDFDGLYVGLDYKF